jgi:tetratricopeptide (TPR) repeat protein
MPRSSSLILLFAMVGAPAVIAETAADALAARRWADAARLADAKLSAHPDDLNVRISRGFARGRLKDYANSMADFIAALSGNPDNALAWHGAGKTLRMMGALPEGFAANERALALAPDTMDYLVERGVNFFLARKFVESSAAFERVNELDPSYRGINAYRAELFLYLKDAANAQAAAAEGLRREPDFGIHRINLAHAALFAGEMSKAKELYLACADLLDMDGVTTGRMLVPMDFERMRAGGVVVAGMEEIEAMLKE